MNSYELRQKYLNIKPEVAEVVKKLQQLRVNGLKDYEIEAVIKQLNLPLKLHIYILGNYSNLMELRFNEVWEWN